MGHGALSDVEVESLMSSDEIDNVKFLGKALVQVIMLHSRNEKQK